MGHVMDLPKSKLGIDVEHDFSPLYEIVADKKKIINKLKSLAKEAEMIYLATDPDREGEAIAYHVKDVISSNSKFARIVFHEITKEAIEEALKNPREIDLNLANAQTARRILDRLVGYKLSPLLWKKVRRGLSAGRVQSVALRLIVEREREIEKFGKEKYYTVTANLASRPQISDGTPSSRATPRDSSSSSKSRSVSPNASFVDSTEFELIEINGEKIEISKTFNLYDGEYKITKTAVDSLQKAKGIVDDLNTKSFRVADVLRKETRRSPQPPYTTSTLQQDASRRLGFAGRRTMRTAQKLYEEGLITYHRTDSVLISNTARDNIRSFVAKEYGAKYVPEKPRFYAVKQKLAQEAHEAIRPTKLGELQDQRSKIKDQIGEDASRLYELIWRRAVASQMSNAVIESTTVIVDAEGGTYRLKANGSVLLFDGFLKVNPLGLSDNRLPKFSAKENLDLTSASETEHETLPPPRYNDASLIKTLEEKGIGRPSTYAGIVATIEDRKYIERMDKKFTPTSIGNAVNDFLVANFSDIDDIPFTAGMEDELDEIANGKLKWVSVTRDFYAPFEKKLEKAEASDRVKIATEETNEKCPECGAPLVIRTGRFGKFLSCSKFPECKFTKAFVEETNLTCPKDGAKIVIKKTKKGRRFYGCSNYPKCDFASWKLPLNASS